MGKSLSEILDSTNTTNYDTFVQQFNAKKEEESKDGQKKCAKCGRYKEKKDYLPTSSGFFPDHLSTICNDCIAEEMGNCEDMVKANKLCQWLDVAFEPNEWIDLLKVNKENTFLLYFQLYNAKQNTDVDWTIVNTVWKERAEHLELLKNIDINKEKIEREMREEWGENYSFTQLKKMQKYYDEIEKTQNVNTAIQKDNAKKMAKLSLQLDEMIENGEKGADIKSIVGSIDLLAKSADFSTKTAKNIGDFDSVGELFAWLEKKGWQNPHYDWKNRDEVDFVIKNIQSYCKRVVTGETNLAADLEKKIAALGLEQASEDDMTDEAFDNFNTEIEEDLKEEYNEEFKMED